ncbi:MAG TPA: hypothetical protein HA282_05605 [Nanoarchaeota archaeon]|nr:MAG: hypothetical protein QT01_C0001G0107 [archaeon GW2011_AR6]MBS3082561.1 hypothetical protein [Candidatus Pacearchaeota archaeon]HIH17478.1 hypothetical protein [Nanoarchaeota archaeon]HIH33939.1 hypothetical protein [Nanoarchaeota archaeon]HIH51770.1 hypothetical protein [Nanoarchaeota archaeon]
MGLMKDKRGVMGLLYNEIIKLIIVAIIGASLLYFIYSSLHGEKLQLNLASKSQALWLDAAFNSDPDAAVAFNLNKALVEGENFDIVVNEKEKKLEIKKSKLLSATSYKIVLNENKEITKKSTENTLEINVKQKPA